MKCENCGSSVQVNKGLCGKCHRASLIKTEIATTRRICDGCGKMFNKASVKYWYYERGMAHPLWIHVGCESIYKEE